MRRACACMRGGRARACEAGVGTCTERAGVRETKEEGRRKEKGVRACGVAREWEGG